MLKDQLSRRGNEGIEGVLGMNVLRDCWEKVGEFSQTSEQADQLRGSNEAWQMTMRVIPREQQRIGGDTGRVGEAYVSNGKDISQTVRHCTGP